MLNGTSFEEIKEITLNMKLPTPLSKKTINDTQMNNNQRELTKFDEDIFALTN